jgi:hypothetical protein
VFRASNVRQDDMVYNGALQGSSISVAHLEHCAAAGLIAAARSPGYLYPTDPVPAGQVLLFDDDFLNAAGTLALPATTIGGVAQATQPRFVFFDSTGDELYVIGLARAASSVATAFTLITYDLP